MEHDLEKILFCQICGEKSHKRYLDGKDHNVSGDLFTITECMGCGFRFTNPRPKKNIFTNTTRAKTTYHTALQKKG